MPSQARVCSRLSESGFRQKIAAVARELSRLRKAEALLDLDYSSLDFKVSSTQAEMDADWYHAIIVWVDMLMTRVLSLNDLESACYYHFEAIWLDQIKEHMAYFHWQGRGDEGTYWSSEAARRKYYSWACEELRGALVSPGVKEPADGFSEAERYIRTTYFAHDGTVGGRKADELIARKAERISRQMREKDAQSCAETFVKTFYKYIIPAITDRNHDAILKVLKAIQHAGSPPSAPDIVNAFEALLAVLFLDAKVVQELWEKSEDVTRQSTF